jgi:urease accessory protein
MKIYKWIIVAIVLAMTSAAWAHPGHIHSGLSAGISHPFTGVDHILAMVAVGLWAVRVGGSAIWRLPLTFVGVMVFGGALAKSRLPLPAVESTIAASVLILGLALAIWAKPPVWAAMLLVGLFAMFHGYEHMAEIGQGNRPAAYALGFVIATVLLHAIGVALGLSIKRIGQIDLMRWAGAGIALCGLTLCFGIL